MVDERVGDSAGEAEKVVSVFGDFAGGDELCGGDFAVFVVVD